MDTFSPPFEPENPPTQQSTQSELHPTSEPTTVRTETRAPQDTWKLLLILGILLFLAGVSGYLYLWLVPIR